VVVLLPSPKGVGEMPPTTTVQLRGGSSESMRRGAHQTSVSTTLVAAAVEPRWHLERHNMSRAHDSRACCRLTIFAVGRTAQPVEHAQLHLRACVKSTHVGVMNAGGLASTDEASLVASAAAAQHLTALPAHQSQSNRRATAPLTLALVGPYSWYSSGCRPRPTSAILEMCLGVMLCAMSMSLGTGSRTGRSGVCTAGGAAVVAMLLVGDQATRCCSQLSRAAGVHRPIVLHRLLALSMCWRMRETAA
jgi:hypothetical protein